MGERKEEDLYRNFSRKDLQGLCKKYGLPAKKSNSEMATSLILYLEGLSSEATHDWVKLIVTMTCGGDPYMKLELE
ncbi:hypothetical protein BVRB_6g139510 [Beta vulgaris subsp. vulgaris]|nr:hypothetical protein BVRB_6g139510 [Beta vulgaris subsp. vulgaris]